MAPCIEVVGYRQRKKGIQSFGDFAVILEQILNL